MTNTVKKFLAATLPITSAQRELIVVPPPSPTLVELAAEINADYATLTQAALTAVEKAIAIGKNLNTIKVQLKHGEFRGHVTSNYLFSIRWGQQCMKLANNEGEVRQELERLRSVSAHLSLDAAFKHLASLNPRPRLKRKKPKTNPQS
jgi:hypothetical protein